MMSSIYRETGERSDWGDVEDILKKGGKVLIRQATNKELLDKFKELHNIKEHHPIV